MNTKSFLFTLFALSFSLFAQAQGPEAFNYQAVIRDSNGEILANEFISLQFTISYSPDGGEPLTASYIEAHDAITNEFGMVNVAIGTGQPSLGLLSTLTWGQPEYHLKTEMDLGSGWVDMGTQQLLSVPFAERADTADDLTYDVWGQSGNADVNDVYDFMGTTTDDDLVFKTNSIENMRIEEGSGNVGIGTNNPGSPQDGLGFTGKVLHVESPSGEGAVLIMSEADGVTNGTNVTQITHSNGDFYMRNHNTDGSFQVAVGTNQQATLVVTANDVTIGSDDNQIPILKVGNLGSVYSRMFLHNSTTGVGTTNGARLLMNDNDFSLRNLESGLLGLGNGAFDALTIDSNNEVGIGTQTPVTQLQIEGGTDASLANHGYMVLGDVSGTNTVFDSNEIIARDNGGVSELYINGAGGNVAIGQTSNPSWLLTVNGTAAKPGGGDWSMTSDSRLKEDVQPFKSGLDYVMKIEPVTYHYIEKTGHDSSVEHVGVIAQELQKVSPSMVSESEMELTDGTKGNYLSVDPSAFTYMLINSVQELKIENERLKDSVEQMQRENTELKTVLRQAQVDNSKTKENFEARLKDIEIRLLNNQQR